MKSTKYMVIIAQGERENLICAASGFSTRNAAHNWAEKNDMSNRIGFEVITSFQAKKLGI